MSRISLAADLAKLAASNVRMNRTNARAAGLSVFNGPTCPVRGHGCVRTVAGSHCVGCIQAADAIKQEAREAGREAALKEARAELAREQKAAEKARLKEEAAAVKAQQKADRLKEAKAIKRATARAEQQAIQSSQAAPVEPIAALLSLPEDDDDDLLPWE